MIDNWKKAIILILLCIILFFGVISFLTRLILGPRPPRPEITRAEFNIRLEYELYGERIVIEDTIIAEFDGFSSDTGIMEWFRTWRLRLASNRRAEHLLLRHLDDGRRIYYHLGGAGYYMGDTSGNRNPSEFNHVFIVERGRNTSIGNRRGLTHQELLDEFGIQLISWEYDPPITNRFR